MKKIDLKSIQSKNYEKNIEREGETSSTCIICGKKITNISEAKYVHLYTDGNIVSDEMEESENSQGYFPVGPNCKNKIPKNFIF